MNSPLSILGATGNCLDIIDAVLTANKQDGAQTYEILGLLDDEPSRQGIEICGFPVIGSLEIAKEIPHALFVNGIGSPRSYRSKQAMIEALGLNTAVISTVNGAAGVHKEDCGEKLKIVADVDWKHFVEEIIETAKNTTANIPMAFYKQFSWKHIVKNILPVFKSSQKKIII